MDHAFLTDQELYYISSNEAVLSLDLKWWPLSSISSIRQFIKRRSKLGFGNWSSAQQRPNYALLMKLLLSSSPPIVCRSWSWSWAEWFMDLTENFIAGLEFNLRQGWLLNRKEESGCLYSWLAVTNPIACWELEEGIPRYRKQGGDLASFILESKP